MQLLLLLLLFTYQIDTASKRIERKFIITVFLLTLLQWPLVQGVRGEEIPPLVDYFVIFTIPISVGFLSQSILSELFLSCQYFCTLTLHCRHQMEHVNIQKDIFCKCLGRICTACMFHFSAEGKVPYFYYSPFNRRA